LDYLRELFHWVTDVEGMIRAGGYLALAIIVFAETGLMFGFFLPGDSLLVTAGLFAAKGDLNIVYLNLLLITMAIVGDATGYFIGKKLGPALFRRKSSRFFKKEHLIKTQLFYEKHGGKTIVIARFVPIIRTFAPVVAGIADMKYRRFLAFNVFGGIGWVVSMTMIGYLLGRLIPDIDKYIEIVIIVVIFLSLLPGIIEHWRARRASRRVEEEFRRVITDTITQVSVAEWEWSREGLERTAASLNLPIVRDSERAAAQSVAPREVRVHVDAEAIRAVEIPTHVTSDTASFSEAGYQNAQWEYAARYRQAVETITAILGLPESEATRAEGVPTEVVARTSWILGQQKLSLLNIHEKRESPFRLSILVEPRGVQEATA